MSVRSKRVELSDNSASNNIHGLPENKWSTRTKITSWEFFNVALGSRCAGAAASTKHRTINELKPNESILLLFLLGDYLSLKSKIKLLACHYFVLGTHLPNIQFDYSTAAKDQKGYVWPVYVCPHIANQVLSVILYHYICVPECHWVHKICFYAFEIFKEKWHWEIEI